MTARLLLSTTALELLRRRVLPPPLVLPPGFSLEPTGTGSLEAAEQLLRETGAVVGEHVHHAVADDLRLLALPEVAVTVRAARPGLDVHACLALCGPRGAGLLRTGDTAVQLSAFRATDLVDELAGLVPAPLPGARAGRPEELPLDALLDGSRSSAGALHATVCAGSRDDRPAGIVGSVEWTWLGGGWTGLQPLPSRHGRPWVRLVPVAPADLGPWLAGLVARAAA